ncbi:hypothetical protein [Mycobacterium botniense]|uniref:Transmembrane protein n=1 Tax=Mycobacterium botniense TaxID=84962 RepID=A0A7I9XTU6_9MYCO|nr:hypothetical protein [Mycobacterium botniense]GFG73431.1 hypothetical protein MBOT_07960 [Mycobacterium botniense]
MPDEASEDRESQPTTEPYTPVFDTGQHRQLPEPADTGEQAPPASTPIPRTEPEDAHRDAPRREPIPPVALSVTVPGRYHYLKWWKLVLVIAGVWVVAAPIGLGLFYWWYHSTDKTPTVFAVLVYVVLCTVGGLMLAMVQDKPLLAALAIAVISAVFASLAAAAPLYGYYYCQRVPHCLAGIIPY